MEREGIQPVVGVEMNDGERAVVKVGDKVQRLGFRLILVK